MSIELDRDYIISVENKGINYDKEKGIVVNKNKSMLINTNEYLLKYLTI
jgi:hypothetical protein